jgi:hypothetical protein
MWALVGLFRIRLKIQRREKPFEYQKLANLDGRLGMCIVKHSIPLVNTCELNNDAIVNKCELNYSIVK